VEWIHLSDLFRLIHFIISFKGFRQNFFKKLSFTLRVRSVQQYNLSLAWYLCYYLAKIANCGNLYVLFLSSCPSSLCLCSQALWNYVVLYVKMSCFRPLKTKLKSYLYVSKSLEIYTGAGRPIFWTNGALLLHNEITLKWPHPIHTSVAGVQKGWEQSTLWTINFTQ
jgi:hypothetical protein